MRVAGGAAGGRGKRDGKRIVGRLPFVSINGKQGVTNVVISLYTVFMLLLYMCIILLLSPTWYVVANVSNTCVYE